MARALKFAQGLSGHVARPRPAGWKTGWKKRPIALIDDATLVRTPLERLLLGDEENDDFIQPRADERRLASIFARR